MNKANIKATFQSYIYIIYYLLTIVFVYLLFAYNCFCLFIICLQLLVCLSIICLRLFVYVVVDTALKLFPVFLNIPTFVCYNNCFIP